MYKWMTNPFQHHRSICFLCLRWCFASLLDRSDSHRPNGCSHTKKTWLLYCRIFAFALALVYFARCEGEAHAHLSLHPCHPIYPSIFRYSILASPLMKATNTCCVVVHLIAMRALSMQIYECRIKYPMKWTQSMQLKTRLAQYTNTHIAQRRQCPDTWWSFAVCIFMIICVRNNCVQSAVSIVLGSQQ